MANHELLNQLATTSWVLDKLRSIQKQCQYSIDKLLDHAKRATVSSSSSGIINDSKSKSVAINDELSHKPNLDALRPPESQNLIDGDDANDEEEEHQAKGNEENPLDLYHKPERNEDGIYRPLKLNPKLMDTPQNMLSKRQERMVEQFKKRVKNSDIYQSVRESMTDLPTEEKIWLKDTSKFASEKHSENRSKSKEQDMINFEEDNYRRLKQSDRANARAVKVTKMRERFCGGEDLDKFVSKLHHQFKDARRLGDYQAGGKFNETVGHKKVHKNKPRGGIAIKGVHWRQRNKILFSMTKKGKQVARRRRWRKDHPMRTNPAVIAKWRKKKAKGRATVKKLLKKIK